MDAKDLANVPLFEGLSGHDLGMIARWADVVDVPAGYHLLNQGSFPHEFFVILDGTVIVERGGEPLATLGIGDFFGEIAIVEDDRRTATVVAETPLRLAVMSTREFDSMRAELPLVESRVLAASEARKKR